MSECCNPMKSTRIDCSNQLSSACCCHCHECEHEHCEHEHGGGHGCEHEREKSNAILYANCGKISPKSQICWDSINKVGEDICWAAENPSGVSLAAGKRYLITFNATLIRNGCGETFIAIRSGVSDLFKFYAPCTVPESCPETFVGSTLLAAGASDANLNLLLSSTAASINMHGLQLIIEEL